MKIAWEKKFVLENTKHVLLNVAKYICSLVLFEVAHKINGV